MEASGTDPGRTPEAAAQRPLDPAAAGFAADWAGHGRVFHPIAASPELRAPERLVEILGPDGQVHYRRPLGHPDINEALTTEGYSVRRAR